MEFISLLIHCSVFSSVTIEFILVSFSFLWLFVGFLGKETLEKWEGTGITALRNNLKMLVFKIFHFYDRFSLIPSNSSARLKFKAFLWHKRRWNLLLHHFTAIDKFLLSKFTVRKLSKSPHRQAIILFIVTSDRKAIAWDILRSSLNSKVKRD